MRQRGNNSWELRVHAGRRANDGRKQYVTRTVRGTKRGAEKELARLVAQVDDGLVVAQSGTIGELVERWFAQNDGEWSPSTADGYRSIIDRRVVPRWGPTPLRKVRASDLDAWYAQLRKSGGAGGRPLAANTVKRIHAVLHASLEQAVKWGWVATNPAAAATPPQSKRRTKFVVPSSEDVVRLMQEAAVVNPALPLFFRLAAATGARRGELCALRWRDLDLNAGYITISRSLIETRSAGVVDKDTKTHADRRVTLDAGTVEELVEYRRECAAKTAACDIALPIDGYVFSHEVDGALSWRPHYVSLAFARLCTKLGIVGVRLHDLRHFNATNLLAAGTDIRTVSGRLGHADASTTLNIYAHFVKQADEKAAGAIGAILDRAKT
jgi:integrase